MPTVVAVSSPRTPTHSQSLVIALCLMPTEWQINICALVTGREISTKGPLKSFLTMIVFHCTDCGVGRGLRDWQHVQKASTKYRKVCLPRLAS